MRSAKCREPKRQSEAMEHLGSRYSVARLEFEIDSDTRRPGVLTATAGRHSPVERELRPGAEENQD
jgi:hypothetical protein